MNLERFPLDSEDMDGLLTRLIEECSEVIQAATKIKRFGENNHHPERPERKNIHELFDEISDVFKVVEEISLRHGVVVIWT